MNTRVPKPSENRSAASGESFSKQSNGNPGTVQAKHTPTRLPDGLKAGIEHLPGYSMNDVNVHYNSPKPATLQAHAYAQGTHIHLGAGQEKHLPHEAWHVVQQKQGRVAGTRQLKDVSINDDHGLEKEADRMGQQAAQLTPWHQTRKTPLKNTQTPQAAVQRKIGFEYETSLTLTKDEGFTKGEKLFTGANGKWAITPDEIRDGNKIAEAEFITDPLDSRKEIVSTVGQMEACAKGLEHILTGHKPKDKKEAEALKEQKSEFEEESGATITEEGNELGLVTAAPQATFDLQLDELTRVFMLSTQNNIFRKKSTGEREDGNYSPTAFNDDGETDQEGKLLVETAKAVKGYKTYGENKIAIRLSPALQGLVTLAVSYIVNAWRGEQEDHPKKPASSAKEIAAILSRISFKSYWLGLDKTDKQELERIAKLENDANKDEDDDEELKVGDVFTQVVEEIAEAVAESLEIDSYLKIYPSGYLKGTGANKKAIEQGPHVKHWLASITDESNKAQADLLSPAVNGSPSMGQKHIAEGTKMATVELRRLPKGITTDQWISYAQDVIQLYLQSLDQSISRKKERDKFKNPKKKEKKI